MKSKSRLLAAIAVSPPSPNTVPVPGVYVSVTAEGAAESSISQTSVYKVTVLDPIPSSVESPSSEQSAAVVEEVVILYVVPVSSTANVTEYGEPL